MKEHPLRTWRLDRRITLKTLAKEAKLGQPFLSEIETWKKDPLLKTAYNISLATARLSTRREAVPLLAFVRA